MTTPYSFSLLNANADVELDVFSFVGRERMSQLYRFEVTVSTTQDVNIDAAVGERALFTMRQERTRKHESTVEVLSRPVYGLVSEVQVGARKQAGDEELDFYRFQIVPHLWKLTLSQRSRVFRDKTVGGILQTVLAGAGLQADVDFRIDLGSDAQGALYEEREFCVQYQESDFAFISRLMEHEGIFYYFAMNETEEREVLVITDGNPASELPEVEYQTGSGLDTDPAIHRITLRRTLTPGRVQVWDNDFEDFKEPGHQAGSVQAVSADTNHLYEEDGEWLQEKRNPTKHQTDNHAGDHSRLEQRLSQIARRRSEEIAANQAGAYRGRVTDPRFWAGVLVEPRLWDEKGPGDAPVLPGGETRFLVTGLHHAGVQRSGAHGGFDERDTLLDAYPTDLLPLLQTASETGDSSYIGAFTCIPAAMTYRAPRTTPVPRVPGILTAKIEEHGGAIVDDEGRYRLRMSFDHDEEDPHPEGSTHPVRMAQPYSGPDYGFHFPNREGADAVVSFIDGDINRPVMLSTVPTPKNHAPTPNTNRELSAQNPNLGAPEGAVTFSQTKNVIFSGEGHKFIIDDEKDPSAGGQPHIDITLATKGEQHKIEMGGARTKSTVERAIDTASTVHSWVIPVAAKEFGGIASTASALLGKTVATGSAPNPYGSTAANGMSLSSSTKVQITGHNGVDIISPNALGIFGGSELGGEELPTIAKDVRSAMVAITNFVINILWKGTVLKFVEKAKSKEPRWKDYKSQGFKKAAPTLEPATKYDAKKGKTKLRSILFSGLQLAGITLKSAGEIQLGSFMKITSAAGVGGYAVSSKGSVRLQSDTDGEVDVNKKLTLRTRGKEGDEADPMKSALGKMTGPIAGRLQSLVTSVEDKVEGNEALDPDPKTFPITLENEHGGVILLTEGEGKGDGDPGHIDFAAEEGDIRTRANTGKVATYTPKEFSVVVGTYDEDTIKAFYEGSIYDKDPYSSGSKFLVNEKRADLFTAEEIRLQTGKDDANDDDAPSIQVINDSSPAKKQIRITCGKSIITLYGNGTIDIEGQEITVDGQGGVTVNAGKKDIKMNANNIAAMAKMKVNAEAGPSKLELAAAGAKLEGAKVDVKGSGMVNVDASGILSAKGSLTKIG
ncbi:MAG: type VI secretion system tip protein VgrG [Bacteroidetes bacterium]|jgi:type VI secretion system secreted protein VgrG|nr:type VI secretion system tip protein VgrG [Bacteroidota bacterium]